jgi:large subunit ribosomal protein L18e
MKLKNKNEGTRKLVDRLYAESIKHKSGLWKSVAEDLNRARRKRFEVNLTSIEKYASPKETIVVPGVVLGSGVIKKHVTVAALRFSGSAKEKIEKAGGKCLSLEELHEKHPTGKGIRILG